MAKIKKIKVGESYFTNQGEEIKIIDHDEQDNTFLGETFDGFTFWYNYNGILYGYDKDYKLSIDISK